MCSISVRSAAVARLGVAAECKISNLATACNLQLHCSISIALPNIQAHWYLAGLQVATSPVSLMRLVRCRDRRCKSNPVTQLLPRCRVSRPARLCRPAGQPGGPGHSAPRHGVKNSLSGPSLEPPCRATRPARHCNTPCTTTHAVMPG